MVNTTDVLGFESNIMARFREEPIRVKIMPEEPKGKICDSGRLPFISKQLYNQLFLLHVV